MRRILFVSDVHLKREDTRRRRAFLDFLRFCRENAREVYILGDLFDVWSGPSAIASPCYAEVADELRRLVESGVSVSVLLGNRDFMLDSEFERAVGVELLGESVIVRLGELNVFLTHGDLLYGEDVPFVIYRSLVRTKPMMDLYRRLPERLSRFLAEGLRHHSRRTSGQKRSQQRNRKVSRLNGRLLNKFKLGIDVVICGHFHQAKHSMFRLNGSVHHLYVLGDWSHGGSYLQFENGEFAYRSFPC